MLSCTETVSVNVGPGSYSNSSGFFNIVVPTGIRLLGAGADTTTIQGLGGISAVNVNGDFAEVSGFTLINGTNANEAGVNVLGGKGVLISRNVIRGNVNGIRAANGAVVIAPFNTIVNNTNGVNAEWQWHRSLSKQQHCGQQHQCGVRAMSGATVDAAYSLFNNTANTQGAAARRMTTTLINVNPLFVNAGGQQLCAAKQFACGEQGDARASSFNGGGSGPDMGYKELIGTPLVLMLGAVGNSCAVGTSGVASVDYGNVTVALPTSPTTATLAIKLAADHAGEPERGGDQLADHALPPAAMACAGCTRAQQMCWATKRRRA